MIVYLIKNLINGKKYVGLTKRTLKLRWYEHVKKSKSKPISENSLHYDILLYGKGSFIVSTIKECISIDDMCLSEKLFIEKFDTMNKGYNRNSGGKIYYTKFI